MQVFKVAAETEDVPFRGTGFVWTKKKLCFQFEHERVSRRAPKLKISLQVDRESKKEIKKQIKRETKAPYHFTNGCLENGHLENCY
jgi:hypothetical protein